MSNKFRICELQNIYSGRVIKSNSIVNFCKEAGLPHKEKFYFSQVLNGQRLHHKNWAIPSILAEKFEVKDIYGNIFNFSVKDWLVKYTSNSLNKIKGGEIFQGMCLNNISLEKYLAPKSYRIKEYVLKRGDEIICGKNYNYCKKKPMSVKRV